MASGGGGLSIPVEISAITRVLTKFDKDFNLRIGPPCRATKNRCSASAACHPSDLAFEKKIVKNVYLQNRLYHYLYDF
eukprot:scaffold63_cov306-Pinguiococcus_pyrenoidosus.AAC.79